MTGNIAIVIPVYNREKLVLRCLDSLASQTLLPAQLIIVDNNSTDQTRQNISEWIEANPLKGVDITFITEIKPGAASARSRGLEEVTADYVYFLDSDDCAKPELVEEIVKGAADNGYPDMILLQTAYATGKEKRYFHKDLFKAQIYQARICTLTFAVRTDFFRKAGGWDSNLQCWDDWELGVRMLATNPKTALIDKILSIIYPQFESITGVNYHSKSGEWERAIDAAEKAVANHPEARGLRRMINYRRLNLAALYRHEGKTDIASSLKQQALDHPLVTKRERLVLKLIYQLTSRGLRGGYILYDYFTNPH